MFDVNVVTGVGKKTNKPYTALEIVFPNGYKKLVFLDGAETFLVINN
ncbi:MAG: hypothetical protein II215_00120 [Paludibacteraceae bacterium]|nr:hypothetical protein [Paludibacteraceae bacterium]